MHGVFVSLARHKKLIVKNLLRPNNTSNTYTPKLNQLDAIQEKNGRLKAHTYKNVGHNKKAVVRCRVSL